MKSFQVSVRSKASEIRINVRASDLNAARIAALSAMADRGISFSVILFAKEA